MFSTMIAALVAACSLTFAFPHGRSANRARRDERPKSRDRRRERHARRTSLLQRRLHATAIAPSPMRSKTFRESTSFVTALSARPRRVGIRGSSSQADLRARRRTADGGQPNRRHQSRTISRRRDRSHRGRGRRRLDALRFGIDRRRYQYHHRTAAETQHRNALNGIV